MTADLAERQLVLALENAPVPMIAHDQTGRVRFLSLEFLRVTGYRAEQIPTLRAWLALAYSDPQDVEGVLGAHQEGYGDTPRPLRRAGEYRVRIADGTTRVWMWRAYSIGRDENGLAVNISMAIDVTAQRASLEALARSEARLRMTLEVGEIGAFETDLVSGEVTCDDRVRGLWGLEPGETATPEDFYRDMHPDDRERIRALHERSRNPENDGYYAGEYRVVSRNDGRVRHVSTRGRALFENGRAVRAIGALVDVTALREAAAVLERDRAQLERLVKARTRELAETRDRLAHAQRMEALGQLAGGIAHDFNNVLQAIEAAADLIERKPEAENLPRYLRMLREGVKRGGAISRRLSSLSRRPELEPGTVRTARLIDDLANVLRRTAGPAMRVTVELAPECPDLTADRRQLETALVNIAANAREAGASEITLVAAPGDAQTARRPPWAANLRPGDYVRLEIRDDGHGMAPEVRARAAEPFFSTKPRGQGVGLGLSMARGFVEQSGGALAIDSEPGGGTAVAIWLPVAVASVAEPPAECHGKRGRLLLVDDDPLVRELVGEQLRDAGYNVTVCGEGRAALERLDSGLGVDCLVTDFAMPEMNGVALAIEARKRLPALPVVVLTGYAEDAADAAGNADFAVLSKPIDAAALIGRVCGMITPA